MKISIQSSTLVKPSSPPSTITASSASAAAAAAVPTHHGSSVIWNSNIDLVIPRIHTPSVYFFRNHHACPDFFSCELLRQSLARALVPFYPMAGRLKVVEEEQQKQKQKEVTPPLAAAAAAAGDGDGDGDGDGGGRARKRRVDIDCNGEGVLFVEAMADGCISEYGELFTPSMEMRRLIPHIHYDAQHSYPLLIIQVTFFKCGGVSLGVGVQHHVADGMAALSFLNYWGQVCRASVSEGRHAAVPPPPPIFFDRTLLKARDPPNPVFQHVEYQTPPPLLKKEEAQDHHLHQQNKSMTAMAMAKDGGGRLQEAYWKEREELLLLPTPPRLQKEIRSDGDGDGGDGNERDEIASDLFVFTKEQLEQLKRRVSLMDKKHERQLDPTEAAARGNGHSHSHSHSHVHSQDSSRSNRDVDGDGKCPLTSYEVLSAHVWCCVSLARGLRPDQVSKLYIATDGRNRLRPPLPEGYFGNAIFTATPMRTVHDLVECPLAETAHAIRTTLRSMNDEYLRSAIDYLELQPDITSLARGAHTFRTPNLGITSWARLPIYDTEFGWGKPVWMGPAGVPFEGLAYILPPPPHSHPSLSMLLSITLSPHHMRRFRQLIHNFEGI